MEKIKINEDINNEVKEIKVKSKKKKVISKESRQELLLAMEETQLELESVRISFQFVNEPNLIEALIYKEREILARYNYLIKEMKRKKVKVNKMEVYKKVCKVC